MHLIILHIIYVYIFTFYVTDAISNVHITLTYIFTDYSQAVLFIQVFTKISLTIKDYINLKFENTI